MSKDEKIDKSKRFWLISSTCVGATAGVFASVPFVGSLQPSARTQSSGAAVEVDISKLEPGNKLVVEWRGKPVWILRRTKEMLESLNYTEKQVADPASKSNANELTPMVATRNQHRSLKPEILVLVGICTHLGCSPIDKFKKGVQASLPDDWQGGFLCPCHGSTFDMAGRVFKNKPAPTNLEVPPYKFLSENLLLIGESEQV